MLGQVGLMRPVGGENTLSQVSLLLTQCELSQNYFYTHGTPGTAPGDLEPLETVPQVFKGGPAVSHTPPTAMHGPVTGTFDAF